MRKLFLVAFLILAITWSSIDGHPFWSSFATGFFAALFVLVLEERRK